MAKTILAKTLILITFCFCATMGALWAETEWPDSHTTTIRALAANRSLLASSKNPTIVKVLKEDREKLLKSLSAELQATELMKDQLVEKAALPKKREPAMLPEKPRTSKATALHQKALGFVADNRLKEATKVYEEIVLNDPDDDEAYILMGHSYFLIGQYAEAEMAYHNAISIDSENRKEIAPFYENFILQNPSDDVAYTNLGYAYLMLGEIAKARAAFKDALSINPSNGAAAQGLEKLNVS